MLAARALKAHQLCPLLSGVEAIQERPTQRGWRVAGRRHPAVVNHTRRTKTVPRRKMITAGGRGETFLLRLHGLDGAPIGYAITADVADADIVLGFTLEAESGLGFLLADSLCVDIGSEIRIGRILHLDALDLVQKHLRLLALFDLLPRDRYRALLRFRLGGRGGLIDCDRFCGGGDNRGAGAGATTGSADDSPSTAAPG